MLILKYIQVYKEARIVKTISKNKNKTEGLIFRYIKNYCKTTVIKNFDIGPQKYKQIRGT